MNKHTPGPWSWASHGNGHSPYLRANHSGALIVMDFVRMGMQRAEPRFSDRDGERRGGLMHRASNIDIHTHPDARLIAAAPTLLDAAALALAELEAVQAADGEAPSTARAIEALRAAIATAGGVA